MHKFKPLFISLIIIFVALHVGQLDVYAEQLNSVKDCYENPENCNEKILQDTGKTNKTDKNETTKTTETNKEENSSVGVTIWDFIKMIFATIFVVALLYFLLKFINAKSRRFQNNQLVENLGGTSLGANRSLQIVKVGDRVFVVGVGEDVQLIKEIDDKEEVSSILSEYNSKIEQLSSPSGIVTKVLKRAKGAQTKGNSQSFAKLFEKQLGELSKGRKKVLEEMKKEVSDKHE